MDFDENADLDTSQVDDLRGSGSGGGGFGGGGFGVPVRVGGGIVGLLLTVVIGLLAGTGHMPGFSGGGGASDNSQIDARCKSHTNAERFKDADCRQIATFDDLRNFWRTTVPQRFPGSQYVDPRFAIFRDAVNTACGQATSDVGPFYCPGDHRIYIDVGFYDELASRFGAPGEFAQAYVIAHEFGHHIQSLTGTEQQVRRLQQRDPGRANQYSVAMELQADCYAGVWANGAASPGGLVGTISDKDVNEALQAAAAVGDDRIQQQAGRQVNPETWTHGSAAQRQKWFRAGYSSGDPKACNTFGS
jgi:predicted metalloprotease